jgi:hypothetical protein
MLSAKGLAKKTVASLQSALPHGENQYLTIAIKAGDHSDKDLHLHIPPGFREVHIVATGDFSDTTDDQGRSGAETALAGPNEDGSFTVAPGATEAEWGIAAGELPTDFSIRLKRVRFANGVVTGVRSNTADSIQGCDLLQAAPAGGSKFWIEQPSTTFDTVRIVHHSPVVLRGIVALNNGNDAFTVKGPGSASTLDTGVTAKLVFCEARGTGVDAVSRLYDQQHCVTAPAYQPLDGSPLVSVGVGFRCNRLETVRVRQIALLSAGALGGEANSSFRRVELGYIGGGCVFRSIRLLSCGHKTPAPGQLTFRSFVIGYHDEIAGAVGTTPPLFENGDAENNCIAVWESNGAFDGLELKTGHAGSHGISLIGHDLQLSLARITGQVHRSVITACEQNGWFAKNSTLMLDESTITCTPDLEAGGYPAIQEAARSVSSFALADLARTNLVDDEGNNWIGSGKDIIGRNQCIRVIADEEIKAGAAVRASGSLYGEVLRVVNAQGDSAENARVLGYALHRMPANGWAGYIACDGMPRARFGSSPSTDARVYLSPTVPGELTTVTNDYPVGVIASTAVLADSKYHARVRR